MKLTEELVIKCVKGTCEEVRDLVKKGLNPNELFGPQTLVHESINHGRLDLVKMFIEEFDVSIESKNRGGGTLLILASLKGKKEIAYYLLSKGANPNAELISTEANSGPFGGFLKNPISLDSLYFAIFLRNFDLVKSLVKHGANPNKVTFRGAHVYFAAEQESKEIVQFLLENGADPSIAVNSEGDQIHISTSKEIIDLLDSAKKYSKNNFSSYIAKMEKLPTKVSKEDLHKEAVKIVSLIREERQQKTYPGLVQIDEFLKKMPREAYLEFVNNLTDAQDKKFIDELLTSRFLVNNPTAQGQNTEVKK